MHFSFYCSLHVGLINNYTSTVWKVKLSKNFEEIVLLECKVRSNDVFVLEFNKVFKVCETHQFFYNFPFNISKVYSNQFLVGRRIISRIKLEWIRSSGIFLFPGKSSVRASVRPSKIPSRFSTLASPGNKVINCRMCILTTPGIAQGKIKHPTIVPIP